MALVLILLAAFFAKRWYIQKPVTTTTLQRDLLSSKEYETLSDVLHVSVTEFEVVKRQTTKKDKIDNVWVMVEVANLDMEGELYYEMVYHLYNDGWLLENITVDEPDLWNFSPNRGVSEEELAEFFPQADIIDKQLDLENKTQTIHYRTAEVYPYCAITYEREATLNFQGDYNRIQGGTVKWQVTNDTEISATEDWHIEGTWEYSVYAIGFEESATVTITDFSPKDIAHCNEEKGAFEVKGTYQYAERQLSNTLYTLSDTDGFLRGEFIRLSNGSREIVYTIGATGEYLYKYKDEEPKSKGNKTHEIYVTYTGLEVHLPLHPTVKLKKVS